MVRAVDLTLHLHHRTVDAVRRGPRPSVVHQERHVVVVDVAVAKGNPMPPLSEDVDLGEEVVARGYHTARGIHSSRCSHNSQTH